MTEITNPHDKFFKEVFGRAEIAAEFMANYLPAEVVASLDLTAPELVKDSFIDKSLQEHFSDLLYKVKLRDTKTAAYIFLLLSTRACRMPGPRCKFCAKQVGISSQVL